MLAMNRLPLFCLASLLIAATTQAVIAADEFKPEEGYVSLFNGHDLTGWGYWTNNFDGKTVSVDGRFSASVSILVVHPRASRLIQKILTTQSFLNYFDLLLDFRVP